MSRAAWLTLLKEQFQLSQLELAFLVQVMPIILGGITSPAWGVFIDRTSPVAGRVAFALLGIFAYAAMFASFAANWIAMAYLGAVLRGMVLGAAEVSLTTGNLYFSVQRERAALYESISALFQGVRGMLMPLVGYVLFSQINSMLFLFPALLNSWSLVLAVRLYRRDRAETPAMAWQRRQQLPGITRADALVEEDFE
jgi:MFS family permease